MRKLWLVIFGLALIGVLATTAEALDIRVAPSTLVVSSPGGRLTVHTDVPFELARTVSLDVAGVPVSVWTFADDRGYLVAQCDKDAATAAVGEFEGKSTTATVTLTVDGHSASATIRVVRGQDAGR